MLNLEGHRAAIMLVAKGGLTDFGTCHLDRLQAAFAHLSGLTHAHWVEETDVVRIVAKLHDHLAEQGLLENATQKIAEYFRLATLRAALTPSTVPAVTGQVLMLNAMMSNLMLLDNMHSVGWIFGLKFDFEAAVRELYLSDQAGSKTTSSRKELAECVA